MNNTFLEFIINLIVLVPVVVLLIFISLRLSKKSLSKIGSGSYVKVLEKINWSFPSQIPIYLIHLISGSYNHKFYVKIKLKLNFS